MIRAIVFDFDGLIFDTETPMVSTTVETTASATYRSTAAVCVSSAPSIKITIRGKPSSPATHSVRERLRINQELLEQQTVLPGVVDLIDQTRQNGLRLAVASNSSREHVDGYLKYLGLYEKFEFTCCRTDDTPPKPAPDLYLAVLKKFDVLGEEALALEDSATGIASARAGAVVCGRVIHTASRISPRRLRLESLASQTLEMVTPACAAGCVASFDVHAELDPVYAQPDPFH